MHSYGFQCSFNSFDHNSVVVTGPNLYKYYKVKELSEFVADHTQVNNKDREISSSYSCHSWMLDTGRLLVCTENGEIMLLENTGEFLAYINHSPLNSANITCIVPYGKGFIIGSDQGEIIIYER